MYPIAIYIVIALWQEIRLGLLSNQLRTVWTHTHKCTHVHINTHTQAHTTHFNLLLKQNDPVKWRLVCWQWTSNRQRVYWSRGIITLCFQPLSLKIVRNCRAWNRLPHLLLHIIIEIGRGGLPPPEHWRNRLCRSEMVNTVKSSSAVLWLKVKVDHLEWEV